jgi:hypothetical protein
MEAQEQVGSRNGLQDQLRSATVVGLLGIALIHLIDLPSKLPDTVPIAVAYGILIAACVVVALGLLHRASRGWWLAAAFIAGATVVAYLLSRTTGLFGANDDVGNWDEPLGIASLFVEGAVIVLALYGLGLASTRREVEPEPMVSFGPSIDLRNDGIPPMPVQAARDGSRVP